MSLRVDARLHETFLAAVLQCCCRACLLDATPTLLHLSADWMLQIFSIIRLLSTGIRSSLNRLVTTHEGFL